VQHKIQNHCFKDNQRDEGCKEGETPGSPSIPKNQKQAKILEKTSCSEEEIQTGKVHSRVPLRAGRSKNERDLGGFTIGAGGPDFRVSLAFHPTSSGFPRRKPHRIAFW
jgi:hypothetical protein